MRVTSNSFYNNIYGEQNKINRQLFDVNKQIASGLQIQYAHEDPTKFADTLRLDSEITTLTQIKNSAQSALKFSTQTDTTIGAIIKTVESMKVKLVNAATDSHSNSSMEAIAKELRGLESYLTTLANTSIAGQYLFSGTATGTKPIGSDGTYQGNDGAIQAFLGNDVKQTYNVNGVDLFLGQESSIKKSITTNMPLKSLTEAYPDIMQDPNMPRSASEEVYISSSSSLRDLMGDNDSDKTTSNTPYFYIQGTNHDGSTFKQKISSLTMDDSVEDLLGAIKNSFSSSSVEVSLTPQGHIEIYDRVAGSSKLDFHLVGAVDFSGGAGANITNIDDLHTGTTDFEDAVNNSSVFIREFTKSGFDVPTGTPNDINAIQYDRANFEKNGPKLTSNVAQILNSNNSIAKPSDLLSAVAGGDLTAGATLKLQGQDINGAAYDVDIDLSGGTFTAGGTTYPIYNADSARTQTDGSTMKYQQLLDVVNMVVSGNIPAGTAVSDYDDAIKAANRASSTTINQNGNITFLDKSNPTTQAQLALYDASSNDYSSTDGAVLAFNANSALTIRDPHLDLFSQLDEAIASVELGLTRPNGGTTGDERNVGIQNAIAILDDLADHIGRLQATSGSYSQTLQESSDRSQLLIVNTKMLQSEIIDTDLAEASLKMNQLSLNYQALLSNISRVSKLSLVNYL